MEVSFSIAVPGPVPIVEVQRAFDAFLAQAEGLEATVRIRGKRLIIETVKEDK